MRLSDVMPVEIVETAVILVEADFTIEEAEDLAIEETAADEEELPVVYFGVSIFALGFDLYMFEL